MAQVDTTSHHSPNYSSRGGAAITVIVLHSGEGTRASDLATLCNNQVPLAKRVSAHYYVCRDGTVYQLVADSQAAWHAGRSTWRGLDALAVQHQSIGIETEHKRGQDWPAVQCAALIDLCHDLIARYHIAQDNIAAHRWIAPGRKLDPTDWPDADLRAWIAALYAPAPPDPWRAWGTEYPLDPAARGFAIPQAWLPEARWLGEARSEEVAFAGGAVAGTVFQGGHLAWERATNETHLLRWITRLR